MAWTLLFLDTFIVTHKLTLVRMFMLLCLSALFIFTMTTAIWRCTFVSTDLSIFSILMFAISSSIAHSSRNDITRQKLTLSLMTRLLQISIKFFPQFRLTHGPFTGCCHSSAWPAYRPSIIFFFFLSGTSSFIFNNISFAYIKSFSRFTCFFNLTLMLMLMVFGNSFGNMIFISWFVSTCSYLFHQSIVVVFFSTNKIVSVSQTWFWISKQWTFLILQNTHMLIWLVRIIVASFIFIILCIWRFQTWMLTWSIQFAL